MYSLDLESAATSRFKARVECVILLYDMRYANQGAGS